MNRNLIIITLATILFSTSCKDKDKEQELPRVSISGPATIDEGNGTDEKLATFIATLSFEGPEYPVEISYYTKNESTDASDIEFIESSDRKKVKFESGETSKTFTIKINSDSDYEPNEEFAVVLAGPVNCILSSKKEAIVEIKNDDECATGCGYITPETYAGYNMVWSDEFNTEAIDPTQWNWEVNGDGGGNNEEQYYINSAENSYMENGNLILVAKREDYQGKKYTSARLTTQGKYSVQYGRVDIRAKVPDARGTWPALWMLGDNIWDAGWPGCGEIDIMELVGYDAKHVHATGHWGNAVDDKGISGGSHFSEEGFSEKYHVYSLIWTSTGMTFYVDDVEIHYIPKTAVVGYTYPFDQKFFFIFNIAVGGDWGGLEGIDDAAFPQKMIVDYVRVFQ